MKLIKSIGVYAIKFQISNRSQISVEQISCETSPDNLLPIRCLHTVIPFGCIQRIRPTQTWSAATNYARLI